MTKRKIAEPLRIIVQYICTSVTLVSLIALQFNDLLILLYCLFIWITLPVLVVDAVSFFKSMKRDSTHKKILLILNSLNIAVFLFWFINPFTKCNADIMEKHYIKYGERMEQINNRLCNEMTPGCEIFIEFEHGKVAIFQDGEGESRLKWKPSDERIDSLLIRNGLDRNSLKWLHKELKNIGCISISTSAVPDRNYRIGFRRIGFGEYSYIIYHNPLSPEKIENINKNDETSIIYSPHVRFVYGSGAIGSMCFPGKKEYLMRRKARVN